MYKLSHGISIDGDYGTSRETTGCPKEILHKWDCVEDFRLGALAARVCYAKRRCSLSLGLDLAVLQTRPDHPKVLLILL